MNDGRPPRGKCHIKSRESATARDFEHAELQLQVTLERFAPYRLPVAHQWKVDREEVRFHAGAHLGSEDDGQS